MSLYAGGWLSVRRWSHQTAAANVATPTTSGEAIAATNPVIPAIAAMGHTVIGTPAAHRSQDRSRITAAQCTGEH